MKPTSIGQGITELMSDADNYSVQYNLNPKRKLTASEKVSVIAGQLLADYMFFEGSTEKFSEDADNYYINCCYCSCYGMLCPCSISISKNQGN